MNFTLVKEHRKHGEDIAFLKAKLTELEEFCKALDDKKQDRRGRKPQIKNEAVEAAVEAKERVS